MQAYADLMLLDLMMPEVDGFALLEAFGRHARPEELRPVLVLTAETTLQARCRRAAGRWHWGQKTSWPNLSTVSRSGFEFPTCWKPAYCMNACVRHHPINGDPMPFSVEPQMGRPNRLRDDREACGSARYCIAAVVREPATIPSVSANWRSSRPSFPHTRTPPTRRPAAFVRYWWLRELDLNQRPSGYEPDELPDCSIPRHR